MLLEELSALLAAEKDLEDCTITQYERSARRFSEHLGRPSTVEDLTPENVNLFLAALQARSKLSGTSVRNYRRAICRLWNFAAELGITEGYNPKRLRQPKATPAVVSAWSTNDVSLLLHTASTLSGRLQCGIPASLFMTAWIRVGYETAFRPSDLRAMTWPNVDCRSKTIAIVQHKTGNPHTALITQQTVDLLDSMQRFGKNLVFPLNKWGVRNWELRLFAEAKKHGFDRKAGQGIGTLRRCHATEVYKTHGLAAAAESLGHVGGTRTVARHYIDSRSINRGMLPTPVAINHGQDDRSPGTGEGTLPDDSPPAPRRDAG